MSLGDRPWLQALLFGGFASAVLGGYWDAGWQTLFTGVVILFARFAGGARPAQMIGQVA